MAFSPFTALLNAADGSWKMSFQSVHFLLFLPIVVGAYFVLPSKFRKPWLLVASYYFYFFAAPRYLPLLIVATLFSYGIGIAIGHAKSKRGKSAWMWAGIIGMVAVLAFFKYNRFLSDFLTGFFANFGLNYQSSWFTTAAALGISYYTFTAIGYLIETAQGTAPAEKNLLTYALFLGFFPSISLGPINRSTDLMVQLENPPKAFDSKQATGGLRLIAIGFFKKLAVADTLSIFVSAIYASPESLAASSGFTLTLAAILFTLQLYFDFSGYTDIARGTAHLLGFKLPKNFNTPFYATNFSGFWARWHMSLSSWLQDYIFTPLIWSGWPQKLPIIGKKLKKTPVFTSIFVVFLVSGIWHGDTLSFVFWGFLQAVFRIGEELCHRIIGKPKKKLSLAKRIGKNIIVLVLWIESLVFFRIGMMANGAIADGCSAIARQFTGISFSQTAQDIYNSVWNGFYNQRMLVFAFIAFSVICLGIALWCDWAQYYYLKGGSLATALGTIKPVPRWFLYFFLVITCFIGFIIQSGGFGGSNFIYGAF